MDIQRLIQEAYKAQKKAYNPYSHFAVGACILTKDGQYIHGCNIENAAYGSTMCAERNAVYHAYCVGYQKDDIEALAIVGDGPIMISPCGACRQVLAELLAPDTPIVLASRTAHEITTISELLPLSFSKENM